MDPSAPFVRGRKPAKRGTGARDMAAAYARAPLPPRMGRAKVQPDGTMVDALEQLPVRGISGPVNRYATLSEDDGEEEPEGAPVADVEGGEGVAVAAVAAAAADGAPPVA